MTRDSARHGGGIQRGITDPDDWTANGAVNMGDKLMPQPGFFDLGGQSAPVAFRYRHSGLRTMRR